jgi:hypothetical protein
MPRRNRLGRRLQHRLYQSLAQKGIATSLWLDIRVVLYPSDPDGRRLPDPSSIKNLLQDELGSPSPVMVIDPPEPRRRPSP